MSEIRKDPVTGRWIIIDADRPLDVMVEPYRWTTPPEECPFCEGHEYFTPPEIMALSSESRQPNGTGWDLRVIPNRFPVLRAEQPLTRKGYGIFDTISGTGAHEIVVTTKNHDQVLAEFSPAEMAKALLCYRDRLNDLYRDSRLRYVSIFTNQGRRSGAKISHPHSQIIATPMVPKLVKEELRGAQEWFEYKERCVFCDMIRQELSSGERIVCSNSHFVAFCPFASRFPMETWIMPLDHECNFGTTAHSLLQPLAEVIITVAKGFSNLLLFSDLFMTLHTAPNQVERPGYWTTIQQDYHWHIEMFPRLLRTSYMEWSMGSNVNPTPPEEAAPVLAQASQKPPNKDA